MGNQQGKQRGQYGRYIDWENAERPSPPGKPYLAPDSADLPDIIKIRWAKPMSDGGAPILGYLVEHRRTGSPHWLRACPNLAPDPELILTGLEPGWRYQFRISAENDIGRSDPGELSEPLTVLLQRSAASAPHFNRELDDTIALENETVELMVHVLATPAPKIAWYKDGFELFSSRRTKIVTDNETSTLIIYQAALEDEGEIKCTATNRAGHAVTKGYLHLEAPPRIRLPRQYEEGLLFEKGEMIRLKVTSAGRPPPTVSWFHNGNRIITGGRHEVLDSDHGSALRVRDACRQDRGEYMVKGTNKIGEDCVAFLVTITDRPFPPGRPQVVMTLGRTVTLSWSCPDDDGGCKIGTYIVEYFRLGWDMWLKAATSRQLTAQLSELIEGSEYKFRIKAENPYGVSEPSEESDVIFIPDPKRGLLKPEPKAPEESWLSSLEDEAKERQAMKEPMTDTLKRRRALEESARKLLDSPVSFKDEVEDVELEMESETAKRRRLLEENARKLLDTPLTVLLAEGPPKLHVIEKPPRRKRDSRSPSVSPSRIADGTDETTPPVPKRRAKLKSPLEEFPSLRPQALLPSISSPPSSSGPLSPALLRDDSLTHGSSELMLVLYPNEQQQSGLQLSAQHRSEIELSFLEPAVAPPLSLSAPELGSEEMFEMPPMRFAVSSTELLHERAMARLYQDAADEEMHKAQMRKKSLERRPSLRETGLERRPSLREVALERRHSFKENATAEQRNEVLEEERLEERLRKRVQARKAEKLESKIPVLVVDNQPPKSILRKDRMSSEEREHLEFAKVRDRLRLRNESNQIKESEAKVRPSNLKQDSSMSSQLSSFEGETGSEPYEGEVEDISVEDEEMLEEEEEEDDYLEEEDEELGEEAEEDEKLKDDKFRPKSLPKPPPVPEHRSLRKKLEDMDEVVKEAPKAVEEDTYHPRSMVPTRGTVRALPATVEVEEEPQEVPKLTLNEEAEPQIDVQIIAEPKPAPEETSKLASLIPIPRLTKKSKILKKIGFGLKKEKKTVSLLIADSVAPVASVVLPKPILKKKSVLRKKDKDKNKSEDSEVSEDVTDQKKKQVRIAEPGEAGLAVPPTDDTKGSPLTAARNQRLQRRQQSLEEEEQANKVLIYHYSDIVREFGGPRKPPPKLYLDLQELEAHADSVEAAAPESIPDEVQEADETATVTSDQEERGSAPDMSEVETDLGSVPDLSTEVQELPEDEPEGVEEPSPSRTPSAERTQTPSVERTHSPSPVPLHVATPEETVRGTMDYLTDVAIFLFACWLYLFKNELYVIPVLVLLVYRQIHETVRDRYTAIRDSVAAKIPSSVRNMIFKETEDVKDE